MGEDQVDTVVPVDPLDPDAVDRFEHRGDQDLTDAAAGHHPALIEQHQGVAVGRSQVEVVQHDHGGPTQFADQAQGFVLVADVEVVGRLVQQQLSGVLGQRPGDQYALPLTTRQ